jgi:hypothetical protein
MADRMKDHENKDAEESGRPVQLDPEPQHDKQDKSKQGMDKDKQGEHGQKPGQQHGSNR